MQDKHHDSYCGMRAVLRWIMGTDARLGTPEAREEAMRKVGQPLMDRQPDPIARAEMSIARMERSTARLNRAIPTRSLDEAMAVMFPQRGE